MVYRCEHSIATQEDLTDAARMSLTAMASGKTLQAVFTDVDLPIRIDDRSKSGASMQRNKQFLHRIPVLSHPETPDAVPPERNKNMEPCNN